MIGVHREMDNTNTRYRRQSIYLLLMALLFVLLAFLLGPNLPLLLVAVVGLGSVGLLIYSGYRRDAKGK